MKSAEKTISSALQVAFAESATHFYTKYNVKQVISSLVSLIQVK